MAQRKLNRKSILASIDYAAPFFLHRKRIAAPSHSGSDRFPHLAAAWQKIKHIVIMQENRSFDHYNGI
jgi:phospholipase C